MEIKFIGGKKKPERASAFERPGFNTPARARSNYSRTNNHAENGVTRCVFVLRTFIIMMNRDLWRRRHRRPAAREAK